MLLHGFHNQAPRHNQGFLVGQTNILTGPNRLHGREQADGTDNGRHNHIGIRKRRHPAVAGITTNNFPLIAPGKHLCKRCNKLFVGNRNAKRRKFPHLLRQQRNIFAGGQADNPEPIRICPDNGQDIFPNGAGRPQ